MPQELRDDDDHQTLKNAGRNERRLIAARRIVDEMIGMNSAVPPPNPAAMMPDARPRLSLNHFSADPIDPL